MGTSACERAGFHDLHRQICRFTSQIQTCSAAACANFELPFIRNQTRGPKRDKSGIFSTQQKGRLKRFHNCYTQRRNRRMAFSSGKSHPARPWIGHLNCGTTLLRRPAYTKSEKLMPLRSLPGSPVQVAVAAVPPAAVKLLPARPRSRSRSAPSRLPSSPASGPPPRSGGFLPAE